MDIENLIADLQEISQKNSISHYKRDRCAAAATALSTLQAENEKLRAELKSKVDLVFQQATELDRRHLLLEEHEAELEQVERERDAAIDCIYKIEDALDRGNDNDWAREHISEWESQKEG